MLVERMITMIIKPGISTLEKCVDDGCRYILVTMAAKRARMIGDNGTGLIDVESGKSVSVAVAEIAAGKVGYTKVKDVSSKDSYEEVTDDTVVE